MPIFFYLLLLFSFISCTQANSNKHIEVEQVEVLEPIDTLKPERAPLQLSDKKVIHALVPLCDNVHQGIVPVNEKLGDGFNLNTNLYWGAGYGVRTFFKKSETWQLVKAFNPSQKYILERLVFKHRVKPDLYFVADAYSGDQMQQCVTDYLNSLAGRLRDSVMINDSVNIQVYSKAQLLVFNGHNGLMDFSMEEISSIDTARKDAVMIACYSGDYFKPFLKTAGGYPLITTTHLLAPEAYVIHSIMDAWIAEKPELEIRQAAGSAYNKYQKCGIKSATRLFATGW